jgi:hypothetical protein
MPKKLIIFPPLEMAKQEFYNIEIVVLENAHHHKNVALNVKVFVTKAAKVVF